MRLTVRNLELQRGLRVLQRDLNFELERGQALWVRGPNGVGKSTLLETLCGFRPVYDGELLWGKDRVSKRLDEYHDQIAYIGHKNGNNQNLTVKSALEFYSEIYKSNEIDAAIQAVGLERRIDILVRELSAGQQKRLALARLVLRKSTIWVLDEPTVSLDQQGTKLVVSLVEEQIRAGGIVVFTSHVDLGIDCQALDLEPICKRDEARSDDYLSSDWEGVL